jgi:hypothetical protein
MSTVASGLPLQLNEDNMVRPWKFSFPPGSGTANPVPPATSYSGQPTSSEKLSFQNEAVASWEDHVPATMSLPNFLLEIDDIPKLFGQFNNLLRYGDKTIRKTSKMIRSLGPKDQARATFDVFGDAGDLAADSYLMWKFGVETLISDLDKSFNAVRDMKKRLDWLKRTRGKPVTIRRKRRWDLSPTSAYKFYTPTCNSNYETWAKLNSGNVIGVCGASLYHDLSIYGDIADKATAMLHTLGFNRPGKILWDAIPFSFLADYVSNLGSLADRFKQASAFPGTWMVRNGWTSYLTEANFDVWVQVYTGRSGGPYSLGVHSLGTSRTRIYERTVGVQTSQGLQLTSRISSDQLKIIAALVKQNL